MDDYKKFYVGLDYMSRNLLYLVAGGPFTATTLRNVTKLLNGIISNYARWQTERAPTGKKVKYVEKIFVLNDKIDMIVFMIASKH